jgi:alginate O-acetyltransferase complex protein AlgI
MLFNSFAFIGLVLVTLGCYYHSRLQRFQALILIASSLFFYAFNKPILLLLLLVSVGINAITSYLVTYGKPENRKFVAIVGVVSNLGILMYFKYAALISKTFFSTSDAIGDFLLAIPLPIGISFFTFQGISLVVDVYKERYFEAKTLIPVSFTEHCKKILLFKTFFPQLIAGPIVKAHDFLPQISIKSWKNINWEKCFKNVVLGYFLKMVIADNMKEFTFWMTYPYFQNFSSFDLLTMLLGYSCQIFADFAGYSLIAIGLAELFGYHFKDNFNFPYISTSFKEFWKRWHISLSSFLMEYLYFPLGGNRKGQFRTYINLILTMLLGGLWHGAAWSYTIWGCFHGLALVLERFIGSKIQIKPTRFVLSIKRILIFGFISFAWLLFKLPQFSDVLGFIKAITQNLFYVPNIQLDINILVYASPIFMYHALYLYKNRNLFVFIKSHDYVLYGLMLFLILTNSGSPGSFIYFQF